MQNEMAANSSSLRSALTTAKCSTRIITYAWGKRYVDTLLTLTLPALLAPGNLPYVASEVPCEVVILTQRRFFFKFDHHPAIARIRKLCPVRLVTLDDLIVSKDKYGMTLTYALHRGFSDLGPVVTEHWQIFLNADFILADGSLRTVIGHLSRGERIVASPSYCTIAEEVIPELRKHLDPATSTLSISHRELARLALQHRHTVIQGKTVNQPSFHMRYADQFYWSIDDATLIGYQMPVAIVGLHPERHLSEPNSYWDYGLIWEYCPQADVCVIGDSDEFMMLELRDSSVAKDQIVPGPPDKKEIAERMATWVTPYQRYFLKFPLTLHNHDLPPNIGEARAKLQLFVDEVMSNAPQFPSHIRHSQWEYHWAQFHYARRPFSRIRSSARRVLNRALTPITASSTVILRAVENAAKLFKPITREVGSRYVNPMLRQFGLEIVKSITLRHMQKLANETIYFQTEASHFKAETDRLKTAEVRLKKEMYRLKQQQLIKRIPFTRISKEPIDCGGISTELKREQSYNYPSLVAQDQLRMEMSILEPEFIALYEQCRQYTMSSWERLYALYTSVRYIVESRIEGDLVECGVWRGGSMKLVAHALLSLGDTGRTLFLYDMFEWMTESDTPVDMTFSTNQAVKDRLEVQRQRAKLLYAPLEEVRETLTTTGYPMAKVRLVKGPVEETIPGTVPDCIALLRLDTDWYSSTKHEMEHLYPRLSSQGVLIVDDYGHYQGACRGVDEYLSTIKKKPLLQRIDHSCRLGVKPIG
jgi:Macrocin-O-methyltransferase (TylF)